MAGSPGRGNRAWTRSTRRMAERQAHALTTPAPASTPRAFLRRSLAVLGRLAWLEVLRVRFLSPPRDVLLPPVPSRRWLRILVRTTRSYQREPLCLKLLLDNSNLRGHGQRIQRRHSWPRRPGWRRAQGR